MRIQTIHRNLMGDVLNECSAQGFRITDEGGNSITVTIEGDQIIIEGSPFVTGYYDSKRHALRMFQNGISGKKVTGVIIDELMPAAVDGVLTPTGTFCSVCEAPQHNTPSGVSCPRGHGGAEPLAPPAASAEDYERELSAVMPEDFKDWHQNDKREWPAVAAAVIRNLREREAMAWGQAASAPAAGVMTDEQMQASAPGEYTDWEKRVWRRGYEAAIAAAVDRGAKICYQCAARVTWLADDSRCSRCTRLTPDEIIGGS